MENIGIHISKIAFMLDKVGIYKKSTFFFNLINKKELLKKIIIEAAVRMWTMLIFILRSQSRNKVTVRNKFDSIPPYSAEERKSLKHLKASASSSWIPRSMDKMASKAVTSARREEWKTVFASHLPMPAP